MLVKGAMDKVVLGLDAGGKGRGKEVDVTDGRRVSRGSSSGKSVKVQV